MGLSANYELDRRLRVVDERGDLLRSEGFDRL